MSWNGSDTRQSAGPDKKRNYRTSPSAFNFKALIAGLVVVIGGGLAAYFMLGRTGAGPEDGGRGATRPSQIAEATPEITTNVAGTVVETPKSYKEMSNEEKLKYWRDRYGNDLPENIKPVVYFLENPPQRTFKTGDTKAKVFRNRSEKIIASVLMIEPGATMLQKPVYDERFDIDFANHVVDEIEILDDDPDDIKSLKQSVIDTKKELAERVKNGERPSDILNAHVDAMYELGKYKQQMTELLHQYRDDPKYSDQDVRDFVDAANKMLREKGATEISMPNMFVRQAKLRAMARKKGTQK